MRIESVEIENYRLFRSAKLKILPRLSVLVGANGSGKSTFFDVFAFLQDALAQNVATAVAKRGGFRELVSRGEKGPIGIALKFRESGGRLATYRLEIEEDGGRPVVGPEILEFRPGRRGGQVFVSTHSPDFLNAARLEEIFWLVKKEGFTTVKRASESELLRKLSTDGDLPGALWKQGLFEGANLK